MSGWSVRGVHVPTGTTLPLDGQTIDTIVRDTAVPGRCDSYESVAGELAALIRRLGIRSEVGAPVVVDGERRGLGSLILTMCERAAAAEGFRSLVLMATLPGEPLYRARGYSEIERSRVTMPDGVTIECVAMERAIADL